MIIRPFEYHGRPTIRIDVEPRDSSKLRHKEPTPMDWLGRLVAKVETDSWRCHAANVWASYVLYVPEFTGFSVPKGEQLETELRELMQLIKERLESEGLNFGKGVKGKK